MVYLGIFLTALAFTTWAYAPAQQRGPDGGAHLLRAAARDPRAAGRCWTRSRRRWRWPGRALHRGRRDRAALTTVRIRRRAWRALLHRRLSLRRRPLRGGRARARVVLPLHAPPAADGGVSSAQTRIDGRARASSRARNGWDSSARSRASRSCSAATVARSCSAEPGRCESDEHPPRCLRRRSRRAAAVAPVRGVRGRVGADPGRQVSALRREQGREALRGRRDRAAHATATAARNAELAASLPLGDPRDFELATRGHAVPLPGPVPAPRAAPPGILTPAAFLDGDALPEVNPSLAPRAAERHPRHRGGHRGRLAGARRRRLQHHLRSGETGWIVVHALTTAETARVALALVNEHAGERPVRPSSTRTPTSTTSATSAGSCPRRSCRACASSARRASSSRGERERDRGPRDGAPRRVHVRRPAPRGPRGHVDAGIGMTMSRGTPGLVAPTELIEATGTVLEIDGLHRRVPAHAGDRNALGDELLRGLRRALRGRELLPVPATTLVHRPRGADPRRLRWSKYISEAIELFDGRFDVTFACHHWPRWGEECRQPRDAARTVPLHARPEASRIRKPPYD